MMPETASSPAMISPVSVDEITDVSAKHSTDKVVISKHRPITWVDVRYLLNGSMQMKYSKMRVGAISTLALMAMTGCMTPEAKKVDTQYSVPYTLPADIPTRMNDLNTHVVRLASISSELPGANAGEHAGLSGEAIDEMLTILPIFEGDVPTANFLQSLRTLKTSKEMLNSPTTAEPGMNQALIASEIALRNINKLVFDNNADTIKSLDEVRKRQQELDTVHEETARVVQGQVLRQLTGVTQTMTGALTEKAGTDGKATTTPKVETKPESATPEKPAEPAKPDAPKPDAAKPEAPKPEAEKPADAPKPDAPKPDAPKEDAGKSLPTENK